VEGAEAVTGPSTVVWRRVLVGLAIGVLGVLGAPLAASADNCSSPADCEQTAGYNTVIAVVGGAAAVAAAAAAAIAAAAEAAEAAAAAAVAEGREPEEPPEPDIVIVQIEPGEIDVTPDQPGQFTVTGWRVDKDGNPYRADDVPLSIGPPTDPALDVQPTQGSGQIVVQVTLTGTPQGETAYVTASGSGKGGTASQQVTIRLSGGYELELY
jgi:hypothetical protein